MKKRTFLKTSSIVLTGSILSSNLACSTEKAAKLETPKIMPKPLKNWAKNLTYSTSNVNYPTSLERVQEIVKKSKKLRGLGSQHSFNTIADSQHQQISSKELKELIAIDETAKTVTIDAGLRYGDFCEQLHVKGYGLHNLASLPHISVAGACSTSTHGSGVKNGSLATGIRAFELVKANGDVLQVSKDKDEELFNAAIVGLGGLGIITKMTMGLQPTYQMQQVVYQDMPMAALESNFETIMSSGYSVSLFTDWKNKNVNEVWIKSRVEEENIVTGKDYYGGILAERNLHPISTEPADNCTEQLGINGPWYERLPHFKMGFTPSSGDELQAEFFIPLENGYAGMAAIEQLHEKIAPHLFISEIRTIAADNFWMSPFYKKACVAIHFTFKPHWDAVHQLIPQIEKALDPFGVRPHWGKLFTLSPKVLQARIEKLADFKGLMQEFDPSGKFRNAFMDKHLFE